jgi:hypothetical protein
MIIEELIRFVTRIVDEKKEQRVDHETSQQKSTNETNNMVL